MTPTAVQTDVPEQDAVQQKIAELIAQANQAFDDEEYGVAANAVDRIPEVHRTPELNEFRNRATLLRKTQRVCESADRAYRNEDYDQAVRLLVVIPPEAHTEQSRNLLNDARLMGVVAPIVAAGSKAIEEKHYDYAVEVLESVEEHNRTSEHREMLAEAQKLVSRITELRRVTEEIINGAQRSGSPVLAAKALPMLEELVSITPDDDPAVQRLQELEKLRKHLEARDGLLASARENFERRTFVETIRLLKKIPTELHDAEIQDLLERAVEMQRRVDELTEAVLSDLRGRAFNDVPANLDELNELLPSATPAILSRLAPHDFDTCFTNLAAAAQDDDALHALLETLIDALTLEQLAEFLPERGKSFLDNCPKQCPALQSRLVKILDELSLVPASILKNLVVLQSARDHLGDDGVRLEAWESCLELIDEFDDIQRTAWHWKDTLIQNPRSDQLDDCARRLAETADLILPAEDRWATLNAISNNRLELKTGIIRRTYAKIEQRLDNDEWSTTSITLITVRRVCQAAFFAVMLTILGAVVQTLLASLLSVGGFAGYALVFFLAGLWTFFYVAANRIL
ncbi:MAG: hypothetical protein CMJ48_12340 [Planctomycetaceae bacterium]|nr:hypothetical protein [Planctomycetaceae bacterium]